MSDLIHVEEQPLVTLVDGFIPVPGPQGQPGTAIKGTLDDPSELPDDAHPGDAWFIDGDLWVWTTEPAPAWPLAESDESREIGCPHRGEHIRPSPIALSHTPRHLLSRW